MPVNRFELYLALILVILRPWTAAGAGMWAGTSTQPEEAVLARPMDAAKPIPATAETLAAMADEQRRNPDELWASRSGEPLEESSKTGLEGPRGTLWTSMSFGAVWTGISVGDLDGDGRQETVMLGGNGISVLRHNGRGLYKDSDVPLPGGLRLLSIDSADINGNGRDEIFISAVREDYRPASLVLEWNPDKARFIQTQSGLDWFLRIVKRPERQKRVLLGQRGDRRGIFADKIEELKWVEGGYRAISGITAPAGANLFGLAYGDLMRNGQRQSIHFTKEDRLRLCLDGTEQWTSGESYGGSESFLFTPEDWAEANRPRRGGDPLPENLLYLPQRLIVEDLDGDGKQELLVVKNEDLTERLFARVRVFQQGRFLCLDWDNVGLTPRWRTRNFTGYISDYAWADIDSDGRKELAFVVVVSRERIGLGRDKSHIVVWKDGTFKAKSQEP